MSNQPQFDAVLHVRQFRDFVVKLTKQGEVDHELNRSIDSFKFAKFDDLGTVQADAVCAVIDAVISELDGNFVESTGYEWANLTETLVDKIVRAFEKLPVELRACDAESLRNWLKNHVGLEILVEFTDAV